MEKELKDGRLPGYFDDYIKAIFQDLQGQLNRRIETQQRELKDSEQHTRTLIEEKDQRVAERAQSLMLQIQEFKSYTDKRLEEQNKFRQQVLEERARYATKELMDARYQELERRQEGFDREMENRLRSVETASTNTTAAQQEREKNQASNVRWTIAIATIVIGMISILANIVAAVLF